MARVFLLSVLVAALAGGVYVASGVVRIHSPNTPLVEEESQAQTATAATNFASAATALQAWFAANGTYAGAVLPDASGVTVARADSTGYCVETGDTTTGVLHELGPGGTPQPGPC